MESFWSSKKEAGQSFGCDPNDHCAKCFIPGLFRYLCHENVTRTAEKRTLRKHCVVSCVQCYPGCASQARSSTNRLSAPGSRNTLRSALGAWFAIASMRIGRLCQR
jgi:hypothetical protein